MASNPNTESKRIKELNGFVLLERVGEGAMGVVFKARQKSLDRIVALKILPPSLAKDSQYLERFKREARASAALNHPNIVQGIDVGEERGIHYFAMEFLEGETLKARFEREGPLPEKDVLEIGRQAADALAHAHSKTMIHRDVKPDNLMLTKDPSGMVVKLMDLGLVRTGKEDLAATQTGTAVGTPYYMAPEQARADVNIGPACDLYALGGTMLHMLAGVPPYDGPTSAVVQAKHITEPPPDPKKLVPEISDELAAVISKLLAKEPRERYASAAFLMEDLARIQNGEEPEHLGPRNKGKGATKHAAKKTEGLPVSTMAVLAVVVVLIGGAIFLLTRGGNTAAPLVTDTRNDPPQVPPGPAVVQKGPETNPPTTLPTPPQQPADNTRLEKLFRTAVQTEEQSPNDLEAQHRAWSELKVAAGAGSHFTAQADAKLASLTQKRQDQQQNSLKPYIDKASKLTADGDFDSAIKSLEQPEDILPPDARAMLQSMASTMRGKAQAEGNKVLAAAAKLAEEGSIQAALDAYSAAVEFKFEPVANAAKLKVEEMKATLESERLKEELAKTEQFANFITKLKETVAARQLDTAREDVSRATLTPQFATRAGVLRGINDSLRSTAELYPLVQQRLASSGAQGVTLAGGKSVYYKLENGRLYFKPAPDFPALSNKALDSVKLDELLALSGLKEDRAAEPLKNIPLDKTVVLGGLLALLGEMDEAKQLLARAKADGAKDLATLAGQFDEVMEFLQHGDTELRAKRAWIEAEVLYSRAKWNEAQKAYRAFLKVFAASNVMIENAAKTQERLNAVDAKLKEIEAAERAVAEKAAAEKEAAEAADGDWKNAIKLIPLIDPKQDAVAGKWRKENGELICEGGQYGLRVEIPYQPPEEYDFKIVFTRDASNGDIGQLLVKNGRGFMWKMGANMNTYFTFHPISNLPFTANPTSVRRNNSLETGRRYTCIIQVRNDGFRALLDGQLITQYKTDYKDIGPRLEEFFKLRDATLLGVATWSSPATFHSIELLEVKGKGQKTR